MRLFILLPKLPEKCRPALRRGTVAASPLPGAQIKTIIYIMIEFRPKCQPDAVFNVKRTCAELGVCNKTLRKLRRMGLISPCNSNPRRLKYTGQSIIDCWDKAKEL